MISERGASHARYDTTHIQRLKTHNTAQNIRKTAYKRTHLLCYVRHNLIVHEFQPHSVARAL